MDKQKEASVEVSFEITDEEQLRNIVAQPIESKCLVFVKREVAQALTDKK